MKLKPNESEPLFHIGFVWTRLKEAVNFGESTGARILSLAEELEGHVNNLVTELKKGNRVNKSLIKKRVTKR
jgi:hypothetical protein